MIEQDWVPIPETVDGEQVKEWIDQYVMRTYTRLPVVFVKGRGARLWDAEGREYIDFESGGRAGNALGHSHPAIAEALRQQADRLLFLSNDFYHYSLGRLASLLAETTPCCRAFFNNSGAEVNETAIKLARKWAKQNRGEAYYEIITALNSFHGRTLATITATGQPKFQKGFEPLPEGFRYVPFNDLQALEEAIGPHTCAVMLEPILGESGIYPATREYLQGVRQLCDEKGLLLILDEVQTGFGRTGRFWAYEHYDIVPDIVTNAKTLGGGLPIGVCLAKPEVASAFVPGDHGCTFGGNPASCTAALTALKVLKEEQLIQRAERLGQLFLSELYKIRERTRAITDIRGLGLMIGFDLAKPVAREVMLSALEKGLVINASSEYTIRLLPALVIPEEDVYQGLAILEQVIDQYGVS